MATEVLDITATPLNAPIRPLRYQIWYMRIEPGIKHAKPGISIEDQWPPARYWGKGPYTIEAADYDLIAEVEATHFEDVFRIAQNFEEPWWEGTRVSRIHRKGPHRSMMDGDVVVDLESGETHLCLSMGWAKISEARLTQV